MSRPRVDPLRRLYSRRQISRAQFLAGQALARADNPSAAESAIKRQCGEVGLELVREILNGHTLADVARANGGTGTREVGAHGWLLRRSLTALARRLGYRA
jgi:hypothetical protein